VVYSRTNAIDDDGATPIYALPVMQNFVILPFSLEL
jgi:hypothetical protein